MPKRNRHLSDKKPAAAPEAKRSRTVSNLSDSLIDDLLNWRPAPPTLDTYFEKISFAWENTDYESIDALLAEEFEVNEYDESGQTLLHFFVDQLHGSGWHESEDESESVIAQETRALHYIRILLAKGARILPDSNEVTVLHHIAYNGKTTDFLEAARLIIAQATPDEINAIDGYGKTALHEAIEAGNNAIALELIASPHCDVNKHNVKPEIDCAIFTPINCSPIVSAILFKRPVIIKKLLKKPTLDIKVHEHKFISEHESEERPKFEYYTDTYGGTLLHLVAFLGDINVFKQILSQLGQSVLLHYDDYSRSALHNACLNNRLDIIALLLNKRELDKVTLSNPLGLEAYRHFINHMSHNNTTALGIALKPLVEVEKREQLSLFVSCPHFNINQVQDFVGDIPLHYAIESGFADIVDAIARRGDTDFAMINSKGETPIRLAANFENADMLKLLADLSLFYGLSIDPNELGEDRTYVRAKLSSYLEEAWFGDLSNAVSIDELFEVYSTERTLRKPLNYKKRMAELKIDCPPTIRTTMRNKLLRHIQFIIDKGLNISTTHGFIGFPAWPDATLYKELMGLLSDCLYSDAPFSKTITLNEITISVSLVGTYEQSVTETLEISYDRLVSLMSLLDENFDYRKDPDRRQALLPLNSEPLLVKFVRDNDLSKIKALAKFPGLDFRITDDNMLQALDIAEKGSDIHGLLLELIDKRSSSQVISSLEAVRTYDASALLSTPEELDIEALTSSLNELNLLDKKKFATQIYDTLQKDKDLLNFAKAYITHLFNHRSVGTSTAASIENRRLDSLATLLEGDAICAAVCFDGEKILLAANGQRDEIGSDSYAPLMHQVMAYYCDIANGKLADRIKKSRRRELLNVICKKALSANPGMNEEQHTHLSKLLTACLKSYPESPKLPDELQSLYSHEMYGKRIGKLITALLKIEDALKTHHFPPEVINAFKKNADEAYYIVTEGKPNTHAEMRIAEYLMKQPKRLEHYYIGISKLCCAFCSTVINSLSHLSEVYEFEPHSRGGHGFCFGWVMNDWIHHDETLFKSFIGEEAFGLYSSLCEKVKKPRTPAQMAELIIIIINGIGALNTKQLQGLKLWEAFNPMRHKDEVLVATASDSVPESGSLFTQPSGLATAFRSSSLSARGDYASAGPKV